MTRTWFFLWIAFSMNYLALGMYTARSVEQKHASARTAEIFEWPAIPGAASEPEMEHDQGDVKRRKHEITLPSKDDVVLGEFGLSLGIQALIKAYLVKPLRIWEGCCKQTTTRENLDVVSYGQEEGLKRIVYDTELAIEDPFTKKWLHLFCIDTAKVNQDIDWAVSLNNGYIAIKYHIDSIDSWYSRFQIWDVENQSLIAEYYERTVDAIAMPDKNTVIFLRRNALNRQFAITYTVDNETAYNLNVQELAALKNCITTMRMLRKYHRLSQTKLHCEKTYDVDHEMLMCLLQYIKKHTPTLSIVQYLRKNFNILPEAWDKDTLDALLKLSDKQLVLFSKIMLSFEKICQEVDKHVLKSAELNDFNKLPEIIQTFLLKNYNSREILQETPKKTSSCTGTCKCIIA